jgi:uncharacterized protein (TIRG00374 family)
MAKENGKAAILRAAALALGAFMFCLTVRSFGGFGVVFKNLGDVGWFYTAVLANSWLWVFFYTVSWQQLIQLTHKISFWRLHKIKIAGEGINFMTPLGFVAGDPIRVMLLQRYLTSKARLSSVVIDRLLHIIAAHLFCFLGMLVIFNQNIGIPFNLSLALLIYYFVVLLFLIWFLVSLFRGEGQGVFEGLFGLFRMRKYLPRVVKYIEDLRFDLALYVDKPKLPLVIAFIFHFFGRLLGVIEIAVIIRALEGRWMWGFATVLTSLTSFAATIFGFIPGALGAMEAFYAHFFGLNGLNPEVGLSVQVVRRMRTVFWILAGMLLIDMNHLAEVMREYKKNRQQTK